MNPFLRPDSTCEEDILTDAACTVLARAGLHGLSVREMANHIGVTPSALTHRWGVDGSARAKILLVVVATFGRRWELWSRGPLLDQGPALALPSNEEEADGTRAWLAFEELARSESVRGNDALAATVAEVHAAEHYEVRRMARSAAGAPMDVHAAWGVCALAAGLRATLVSGDPAIDGATARDLLRSAVEAARRGCIPDSLTGE